MRLFSCAPDGADVPCLRVPVLLEVDGDRGGGACDGGKVLDGEDAASGGGVSHDAHSGGAVGGGGVGEGGGH